MTAAPAAVSDTPPNVSPELTTPEASCSEAFAENKRFFGKEYTR